MDFKLEQLIYVFNKTFVTTRLVPHGTEPLYIPKIANGEFAQIVFKELNLSSALHEISHWCIAGKERRLLEDFGYWYEPDGRSPEKQKLFEQFEIKPQALEWILADSINHHFTISLDNLAGKIDDDSEFEKNVITQKCNFLFNNIPGDASKLIEQIRINATNLQTLDHHL